MRLPISPPRTPPIAAPANRLPAPPPATAAPRSAPLPAPSNVPVFSRGPGPNPSGLPAQAASERPARVRTASFDTDIDIPRQSARKKDESAVSAAYRSIEKGGFGQNGGPAGATGPVL